MLNIALTFAALQEHEAPAAGGGLMSIQINLMFWTLVIFLLLFWILKRYAFPVILSSVEAREKALEEAIDAAKRDRDEAARLLAEQKAQIEGARGESQKIIAEAREIAEKLRADTLEKTRQEQQEMLARAVQLVGGASRQVHGGTFHGTAHRLLRRFGPAAGLPGDFTIMDQGDAADLMQLSRAQLGYGGQRRHLRFS